MIHPKKWYFISLLFSAGITFLAGLLIFIIDPLAHYRYPSFYKLGFIGEERFLAPGIAANFDYDCPILGTSLIENFIPSYLDKKMAVNSIRLCLQAGTAYELGKLLDIVIRAGQAKKIIYALDLYYFRGAVDRTHPQRDFPLYLYDENPFNDLPYLLNISNIIVLMPKIIIANLLNTKELSRDPSNNMALYNRAKVIESFKTRRFDTDFSLEICAPEKMKRVFDINLLSKIEANNGIEFIIYFPPYSILAWKDAEHKGVLENYLQFKKYVFERTRQLKNVRLYDFQDDENITHNLDNYTDRIHYSPEVNRLIINAIATNNIKYLLSEETLSERLDILRRQVVRFDIAQIK